MIPGRWRKASPMRLIAPLPSGRIGHSSACLLRPYTIAIADLTVCRKKFAKLKIQFELRMKESESLIREELRIQDLSKRIQEQNEYVERPSGISPQCNTNVSEVNFLRSLWSSTIAFMSRRIYDTASALQETDPSCQLLTDRPLRCMMMLQLRPRD